MSTYSPLNQSIFQAAFAGAFAAMTGKGLGSGTPNLVMAASFGGNAAAAYAFAQEYDTARGGAAAANTEVSLVQSSVYKPGGK